MDAAIGILLSFALLIPLIIMESFKLSPMVASLLTIGSFVLGLAIFAKRQSIKEESGFLAVVLTSLGFGKAQKVSRRSEIRKALVLQESCSRVWR